MTLKQLKDKDRIIFLKKFTAELIINTVLEEQIKLKIEAEKLRQKINPIKKEVTFNNLGKNKIFQTSQFPKINETNIQKNQSIQEINEPALEKKPMIHRIKLQKRIIPSRQKIFLKRRESPMPRPFFKKRFSKPVQKQSNFQMQNNWNQIRPEYQPRPEDFNLGKIEVLLKDPTIQLIECQGPGKNLFVKRYNKMNVTKITLTPEEIITIINDFSQKAKIPVIGGILKAAVGNLVISALISEFIGAKFIITKINSPINKL